MKHLFIMVAASTAIFTSAAWGQTCTIVTDGSPEVYWHEVAHCNGWWHEPFAPDLDPPEFYVFPYEGKLIHLMPEGEETVASICQRLWKERGIVATAMKKGVRLTGCAVQ